MTRDVFRTNGSIFQELVETGIILSTKSVRCRDFIGDYQYLSETIRVNHNEPTTSDITHHFSTV
jgi:hypothetical protein